ncbi:MAG: OmpA family protein [Candidatus Cloacimonas acidaminovorans]|jgi:outer membrane protein OmpA-like peptidoglycan-associated protein
MKSDNRDELNYWPSFADIFSSLFFIFFILFSIFYFNYSKRVEADQKDIDDFKSMFKSLDLELNQENNEIIIPADILFEFDKSELIRANLDKIWRFREELKNYMQVGDRKKRYCIIIEGHTDTVGDKNYNYKLSLDRSLSLIKEFKEDDFFRDPDIDLIPAAFGESKLAVLTPDNTLNKKNRRVVIRIVPKFIGTMQQIMSK